MVRQKLVVTSALLVALTGMAALNAYAAENSGTAAQATDNAGRREHCKRLYAAEFKLCRSSDRTCKMMAAQHYNECLRRSR